MNKLKANGVGLKQQGVSAVGANESVVQQAKPPAKTSSSLDDFFTYLDIENLGNNSSTVTASNANTNASVANGQQLIKIEAKSNSEVVGAVSEADNLSETKATLEMSLKNSAELLKQLSSIGQIEHMHQLENQMKESMQLIEKLKSASSSNNMQQSGVKGEAQEAIARNSSFFETINNYPNKLKTVTSIPSNLKSIAYLNNNVQQQQPITNGYFQQHGPHYPSHNQLTNSNLDIPFNKNVRFSNIPFS